MVERYIPNGEPLTEREHEIIINLAEEAVEVAHAAMKLLRFGKEDTNQNTGASNSYVLGLEIGNLVTMLELVAKEPLVIEADIDEGKAQKLKRLAKFTRHLP